MNKKITVLDIGTNVFIGEHSDQIGTIIAITIRQNQSIIYEISYWNKLEYKNSWFYPYEIKEKSNNENNLLVGFAKSKILSESSHVQ